MKWAGYRSELTNYGMEESSKPSRDNNTARPTVDHCPNGYNPLLDAICIPAFHRNDSYNHLRQPGTTQRVLVAVVITYRDAE
jgi:hypothetical protein